MTNDGNYFQQRPYFQQVNTFMTENNYTSNGSPFQQTQQHAPSYAMDPYLQKTDQLQQNLQTWTTIGKHRE